VIVAVKKEDGIHFIDPQTRSTDTQKYADDMKYRAKDMREEYSEMGRISYFRMDDKNINYGLIGKNSRI
jgi:hypothetical protein